MVAKDTERANHGSSKCANLLGDLVNIGAPSELDALFASQNLFSSLRRCLLIRYTH